MNLRSCILVLLLLLSKQTFADWQKFESDNFILYSKENKGRSFKAIRSAEVQLNVLKGLFPSQLKKNRNKLELILVDQRVERSNLPRRAKERDFGIYLQRRSSDVGVVSKYRRPTLSPVPFYYIANTELSNFPYWYLQGIALITGYISVHRDFVSINVPLLSDCSAASVCIDGAKLKLVPLEDLFENLQIMEDDFSFYISVLWTMVVSKFTESPELRAGLSSYFELFRAGERNPAKLIKAFGMTSANFTKYMRKAITQFPRGGFGGSNIQLPLSDYDYSEAILVEELSNKVIERKFAELSTLVGGELNDAIDGAPDASILSETTLMPNELSSANPSYEGSKKRIDGKTLLITAIQSLNNGDYAEAENSLDKLHFSYHYGLYEESDGIHNLITSVREARSNLLELDIKLPSTGIRWNKDADLQVLANSISSITKELTKPSVTSSSELPIETGNDKSVSEDQVPINLVGQLERLSQLFSDGVLSEEEFQAAKQRILTE